MFFFLLSFHCRMLALPHAPSLSAPASDRQVVEAMPRNRVTEVCGTSLKSSKSSQRFVAIVPLPQIVVGFLPLHALH
jgi:hypothetical protein